MRMKLDIRTVHAYADKNDEKLWQTLRLLAGRWGFEASPRLRQRIDFDALRETLASLSAADAARAEEIAGIYQAAKRGGGRR